MSNKHKKKLAGIRVDILATNGFEQAGLEEPRKALRAPGAHTALVSPESGRIWTANNKNNPLKFRLSVSTRVRQVSLLPGHRYTRTLELQFAFVLPKSIYPRTFRFAATCAMS